MKKCSRCSKPATLHITELQDGDVDALHLCESCAHEYLNMAEPLKPLQVSEAAKSFAQKLAEVTSDEELDQLDQLVCPNCGISFREFRSQGRLGCPHDYSAFENELMPLLENIHGETQHTGKTPRRAPGGSKRQYRLIKLRSELKNAVEKEDYEDAARLRDQIQTTEETLNNPDEVGTHADSE